MFGFLTANTQLLSEDALERYRGYYCGLCRELGDRYGIKGRLTLNYDMTFMIILLGSVYESDEESDERCCIMHPFKRHKYFRSRITTYAADMNIALAYLKLMDNWSDDHSLACYGGAALLRSAFNKVRELYPRQVSEMERSVNALRELEQGQCMDADKAADTFGVLMECILSPYEDYWDKYLRPFGRNLGRFIYLLDAVVDLEKDTTKGSYNVFSCRAGSEDNRIYFTEVLKIFLGDAIASMNMLPIDRDRDILDNILCFGIWSEFNKQYCKEGTVENE